MAHVRSTVEKIAELAREGQHTYAIRNLATRIVHHVPSKQVVRELFAIYKWVRDEIRYRFDPDGLEWVQSPIRTVKERAGDCDDMTGLIVALAGSLGHKWRLETAGATPSTQKHVYARVWTGREWLTLDPVLEPAQATTAPRHDVGTFAMTAGGARLRWNDEGQQMQGYLGAPATQRQRSLWLFSSYYSNPLPHGQADGGIPLPGVAEKPDLRYGSPDRPGYYHGSPIALSFAEGAVEARYMQGADTLGRIPYEDSTLGWGFLKKIGKAIGKVAKKIKKIPGVSLIPGVAQGLEAASMASKLSKLGGKKRKRRKKKKKKKRGRAKARGKKRGTRKSTPRAAPSGAPGNYVTRSDMSELRQDIRNVAQLARSADIERLVRAMRGDPGVPGFPVSDPFKKRKKKRKKKKKKKKKARAKGKRYQKFDSKSKVFRVFKKAKRRRRPRRRASKLSGFRPTISFALGKHTPEEMRNAEHVAAALTAQKRVQRFVDKVGAPPAIKMGEVRDFQEIDDQLTVDGLYGPNVRAALSWYLQMPLTAFPASRWPKKEVTWMAPAPTPAPAPAPVIRPAPVPVIRPAPVPVIRPVIRPVPVPVPAPRPAPTPEPIYKPTPAPPPPRAAPTIQPVTQPTVPGFQQVAVVRNDPGLPPLPIAKPKVVLTTASRNIVVTPGVPTVPPSVLAPRSIPAAPRPVLPTIKTAIDAPPINQPRPLTPQDFVDTVVQRRRTVPPAKRAALPPVPTIQEAAEEIAEVTQQTGKPPMLPPLSTRVAQGQPPLPSDKAVAMMPAPTPGPTPPSPAFPAPPMAPSGEPSTVPTKGKDGEDNVLMWIGLWYLFSKRKAS